MKRIQPPFAVGELRGKLGGSQTLEYAENNNPAYESPKGKRNYARNYKTCLVACKRASDGLQYFQIRTKSSVNMTAKAVKAMALLGGTGAIVGFILAHKTSELYAACYAQWLELQSLGSKKTFRKSLTDVIMAGLKAKSATIVYAGPRGNVNIDNPWMFVPDPEGAQIPNVTLTDKIIYKFWSELGPTGAFIWNVTFPDGMVGILPAKAGENFEALKDRGRNILTEDFRYIGSLATQSANMRINSLTYGNYALGVMEDETLVQVVTTDVVSATAEYKAATEISA